MGGVNAATIVVNEILENEDFEFWHTNGGQSYISRSYEDLHVEHHLLLSKTTRQWLANFFYEQMNWVPGPSTLTGAIAVLEGHAQKCPTYETCIRIGGADGAIYIDLCNKTWDAIEVTKKGWKIIKNPPVKFQRTNGMLPLPEPVKGGSLDDDLRPLLNADSDDSWLLLKGWLLGLLLPEGPHPILAFRGEQDTAKSYTQKLMRAVVDPSILPIRRPAKKVEDLMIAARNNWVVSFDNMSKISDNLSDDLCCVATGGGIAKRALWTDSNETILQVCRPIVMNGIGNIITKQDLLDRAIYITLYPIPSDNRHAEDELIEKFNGKLPKILGALLDSAVIALKKQNKIKLNDPYRMAGFVKFAAAGLGTEGDKFQAAYRENRDSAVKEAISDDVLVNLLRECIPQYCHNQKTLYNEEPKWEGTATDLLRYLTIQSSESQAAQLPKSANALSEKLRGLAPALRQIGIDAKKIKSRTWCISIVKK